MKIQITFDRIEFLKPYSFFLLLKTPNLSKRTEISEFTITPEFANKTMLLDDISDLQVSACIVLDYSGRLDQTGQTLIFGRCDIGQSEYLSIIQQNNVYQQPKQFVQEATGGRLVVGHFQVTIKKYVKESDSQYLSDVKDFKMEDEKPEQDEASDLKLRVDVHAGVDFPHNSGFFIQIGWSDKYRSPFPKYIQSSKMIQGEMNPMWREQLVFPISHKNKAGFFNLLVRDKDNCLVQQVSFDITKLQSFFHYHVQMPLKEQMEAMRPKVFFSFVFEAVPEKNFIEQICQLAVTNIEFTPEPQANRKFFVALSTQQINAINFVKLELKGSEDMAEANFIQHCRKSLPNYFLSPILISPIKSTEPNEDSSPSIFKLPFLKSNLIKHNNMFLFEVPRSQKFQNTLQGPIAACLGCTASLKSVFYEEQKAAILLDITEKGKKDFGDMKCLIELGSEAAPKQVSENSLVQPLKLTHPVYQKWKGLSNDVFLKQKLLHSMRKQIQQRTRNIEKKGDVIEALRRAEKDLSQRNYFLKNKVKQQESIRIEQPIIQQKVNLKDLYRQLVDSTEELHGLITRNEQSIMRMDLESAIDQPQVDIKKFQEQCVRNSRLIQEMQERTDKISFYTDIVRKQKQSILKLQRLFEQSQIDKQMNEIMRQQLSKLQQKKVKKTKPVNLDQYKLTKILAHLDDHKLAKPNPSSEKLAHLKRQIEMAEDQLKRKSEYYAKLLMRHDF